ncbi:hypothetical protein AgCh_018655 [Apium graveolens]
MVETIKKDLEIDVSRIKIIRERRMALEGVYDALKAQYSRLRDFGHELLQNNPRNTVKISTTRLNETVCGGQLLSVVGRDGNNQMFPVAYAIVESENTESWTWFTELLKDDLDLGNGYGITIISDQQKEEELNNSENDIAIADKRVIGERSRRSIIDARKVESYLTTFATTPPAFLINRAIECYGKCGCLSDARELFDEMS